MDIWLGSLNARPTENCTRISTCMCAIKSAIGYAGLAGKGNDTHQNLGHDFSYTRGSYQQWRQQGLQWQDIIVLTGCWCDTAVNAHAPSEHKSDDTEGEFLCMLWLIPHPLVLWQNYGSMECIYVCMYVCDYNCVSKAINKTNCHGYTKTFRGHTMALVASCWSLTVEVYIRSPANPSEACDGKSDNGRGFNPST
jgi:hypothetical protein